MIDKLTDDLMSLQFMGRHGEINKDWIVLDRPIRPKETRISPIPSTTRLIYDYSNARDSSIFVEKHESAYDYLVNKYPNNFENGIIDCVNDFALLYHIVNIKKQMSTVDYLSIDLPTILAFREFIYHAGIHMMKRWIVWQNGYRMVYDKDDILYVYCGMKGKENE